MAIYEINNQPTVDKIEKYNDRKDVYYRFQMKDWEMGNKSWGMIFGSEEEALEDCEEWGYTKDNAILNGKSACSTAEELYNYSDRFDRDFRVLVLTGSYVEEGHDGEDVVDVDGIIEIWDFEEFCKLMKG